MSLLGDAGALPLSVVAGREMEDKVVGGDDGNGRIMALSLKVEEDGRVGREERRWVVERRRVLQRQW